MRGFGLRFKLFGFPVIFDLSFFMLVGLILFLNLQHPMYVLTLVGCILVSVLVHEFGHAIVGRIYGLEPSIHMNLIGGLTRWSQTGDKVLSNLQQILIILAGPFAGFAFGGLVLLTCLVLGIPYQFTFTPQTPADTLLLFNFMWGLANLLPMYPLDGGQALYYTLRTNKNLPAERISTYVSIALGGAALVWAFYAERFWIAFLLIWLLSENFRRFQFIGQDREEIVRFVREQVREIGNHINHKRYPEGLEAVQNLLETVKDETVRAWATRSAAVLLDLMDDPATTREFIQANRRHLSTNDAIRFLNLKADGETAEAMAFAQRAMYARPTVSLVSVYISQLIREGNVDQAMEKTMEFREAGWFTSLAIVAQIHLMNNGAYRESIRFGEAALEKEDSFSVAYNVAAAYARLHNVAEAISRLEDAIRRGFRDVDAMEADEDFASLHDHHGFISLVQELREKVAEEKSREVASAMATAEKGDALAGGRPGQE